MKAVMMMFDSLNRHYLQPYGCEWTHTPNFTRLAEKTAKFNNSYVSSMPCMPARRELHTARPNFLHRSWGPLEPFDDSVPEILKNAGVYTHLVTDHEHYWEDGGCTYHPRYNTFEFVRGQEGDPWIGQVADPEWPEQENDRRDRFARQDLINRQVINSREHFPMHTTFRKGIEFMERNLHEDNWFLQLESFDPHEPFFALDEYRTPYAEHFGSYRGKPFEWPLYRGVEESREAVEHCRYEYAALLNACDQRVGEVLDFFDKHNLWKDTLLIVNTDHGFLLGEHHSWAKCWLPFYNEIAHTPFFLWDPRFPDAAGTEREALVQPSLDLGPTLLDYFGLEPTRDMTGKSLAPVMENDRPVRDYALFGIFGGQVNITDGRYVYMRGPADNGNGPLYEYTLMPTHMRNRFHPDEFQAGISIAPPFSFTKNCQTMKIPSHTAESTFPDALKRWPTVLFDLSEDPGQQTPGDHPEMERTFVEAIRKEMSALQAPEEQYRRLGLHLP